MSAYKVIGLMSGTSLDGVDVALCQFSYNTNGDWQYRIINAKTYPYNIEWKNKLANLHTKDALTFVQTDAEYGKLLAEMVNQFCVEENCKADLIASHGHTIFHNPNKGFSTQIGHGATIAALTKNIVVSDFRSLDVAMGGQGAPLVPLGDKLLFSSFNFCINLGGFANISFDTHNKRVAFDICPANIILNQIYKDIKPKAKQSPDFDPEGEMASKGKFNKALFRELNNLPFYALSNPKSLGREWLETDFLPVLNNYKIPLVDKLHTISQHIAYQIAGVLNKHKRDKVLITGGGAYNSFLISLIKKSAVNKQIIIPDNYTIEFKEALIFAFLGLLRYLEEPNCLKSVTGAERNSCSGAVYWGKSSKVKGENSKAKRIKFLSIN